MNYCNIKKYDIANGLGVRTSLFVSGCRHHCKGCFQPETWDFNYGEEFTQDTINEIIESLKPDYIKGLSLLGGEPFEPENQKALCELLSQIKNVYNDSKDVWCYSGYRYEEITNTDHRINTEYTLKLINMIDVLVDGEFEIDKKNISLKFRGSENQRLINLHDTTKDNIVLLNI